MLVNNYQIGAALTGVAALSSITTYLFFRNKDTEPKPKFRRADIRAFKGTMTERYKQLDLVELEPAKRQILVQGTHDTIDRDIHQLFDEVDIPDLIEHNNKLFSKHSH